MLLVEAHSRPRKSLFTLTTAAELLAGVAAELGTQSPQSPAARAVMLAHMRRALAAARQGAEAELRLSGRGTRCAMNLAAAEDEIIKAIHLFAVRDVYPVDNPSGAEAVSIAASRSSRPSLSASVRPSRTAATDTVPSGVVLQTGSAAAGIAPETANTSAAMRKGAMIRDCRMRG